MRTHCSLYRFSLLQSLPLPSFRSLLLGLILCCVGTSACLHAQSTTRIVTTGGEVYKGRVEQETADTIVLRSEGGTKVTIPRSAASTIDYHYDDTEKGGYWSFGGVFGTPAGLNLVIARNFDWDWGLRLSGLILPTTAGGQLDLTRRIGGTGSFRHNLHLGAGTLVFASPYELDYPSIYEGGAWTYLAGGYDLNWSGLYAALDLSIGYGTATNPQLLFQIGYVHQFR